MENGSAGRARLKIAKNISVRQRPIRMATKHARVVFQSPYEDALPTYNNGTGTRKVKE